MVPSVQIKGIREGLLITFGEGSWEDVQHALLEQLDQQADFMRGARLAIDVGNRPIKAADLGRLRSEIQDRELTLWAVLSESPTTVQTAQTLGLATRITKPRPDLTVAKVETNLHGGEQAVLLRRTLRSGFSIEHDGHVIIIGDINPGAEVKAGGDIIVWGRARGMLHAGSGGNAEAVVCALDLSPTQLWIAGKIAGIPQRRGKTQPEMARLQNDQVIAEPWDPKKAR
ncbi:MAG: minC [Chloroflexi bacterium]|jgi:septum site-determining protein MinC|nr:minC [Chloroflexota bacterium]